MYAQIPYAASGAGPPVLLIGGLLPVTGVDRRLALQLTEFGFGAVAAGHRLIVTNRRPGLPSGVTMHDFAQDYAAAIRAMDVGAIDVIGLSTGGSIAQHLAAQHPDLVRRLVLVSTAYRLSGKTRESQSRLAAALRAQGRCAAAATVPRRVDSALVRRLAGRLSAGLIPSDTDAADLAATLEAEDGFDLRELPVISAKTLLIGGARDHFYPRRLFDETVGLIDDCRLHLVPRRGHASVLIGSGATRRIVEFLHPD